MKRPKQSDGAVDPTGEWRRYADFLERHIMDLGNENVLRQTAKETAEPSGMPWVLGLN